MLSPYKISLGSKLDHETNSHVDANAYGPNLKNIAENQTSSAKKKRLTKTETEETTATIIKLQELGLQAYIHRLSLTCKMFILTVNKMRVTSSDSKTFERKKAESLSA
jgi:ribosomal protein S12 methylthiotransferase accessory factor YcaO